MGRWAQHHRRGSDRPHQGQFPLAPPTNDDWVVVSSFLQITACSSNLAPPGANGVQFQVRLDAGPWTILPAVSPDDCRVIVDECSLLDDPYEVQARYVLDADPVSDWSESQFQTCLA